MKIGFVLFRLKSGNTAIQFKSVGPTASPALQLSARKTLRKLSVEIALLSNQTQSGLQTNIYLLFPLWSRFPFET